MSCLSHHVSLAAVAVALALPAPVHAAHLPGFGHTNDEGGVNTLLMCNTGDFCFDAENASAGNGAGMWGRHFSTGGTGAGVVGQTLSAAAGARGVYGEVNSGTIGELAAGVRGHITSLTSSEGAGVYGSHGGFGFGVYGSSRATGVYGEARSGITNTAGVRGVLANPTPSEGAAGVHGQSRGSGFNGFGVFAEHLGTGIAVYGEALNGFAVSGFSPNNWAGYFHGSMRVVGNLQKNSGSFTIDHPLDPANKYLSHSFVESPDMKNVYDGVVTTDARGFATVKLPRYFGALNKDFRYQLTVIGEFAQAIVAKKIAGNRFTIRTDKANVEVSWQVTGIRKDRWANAHRIKVEERKTGSEAGKYLNPELYGKAAMQSVVRLPGMNKAAVAAERR